MAPAPQPPMGQPQTGQPSMPQPMPMPQMAPQGAPAQPNYAQPSHGQPSHGQPPQGQPMHPGQAMPTPHPMPTQPGTPQPHMPMQGQPQPQMNPAPLGQPPMGQAPMAQPAYPGLVETSEALMAGSQHNDHDGGERVLPQISIHAFCERNELASCINQMTRDWRMRRTNTKIYMGGLPAAIDYYSRESTPGLIMIESGLRGPELFAQLEQLASVCDEGTRVVVVGAANDIRLYRQLIEKGVSDYLVPPLTPLNIIRSLSEIYSDPEQPFTGRAVAFFGSKGGVGSSTLAHNIAWVLAERLMNETALIDLDTSWGTTALDFAYDNASGLEEALADADRLDDTLLDRVMLRHTERLSILPTSSSLNTMPITDSAAYDAIVSAVRSISPLSVFDIPHVWDDWTTNLLTTVDDVVITAIPDLANLRNTKNLIDFLKAQRPHDVDPILILNQTGRCRTKEDEISVENFAGAVGLEPSLVIGFDPDTFSRACNEGKMLPEMKTADALVPGLEYIANRLRTGQFTAPPVASIGGLGSRLGLGRKDGSASGKEAGAESKSLIGSLLRRKG